MKTAVVIPEVAPVAPAVLVAESVAESAAIEHAGEHDGEAAPERAAERVPERESSAVARRTLIEQTAAVLGRTWAQGCRDDLHREGRLASGGWPGTLNEARARVGYALLVEARGRQKKIVINEAERELAVRAAYASARDEWRRHVEPEGP